MIRPRWRKVISDLWDNKLRTLLVVLSIAVGVFAVGMIAGSYVIISTDMSVSYASSQPANIEVWVDGFTDDLVDSITNNPQVLDAEGRRVVNVLIREPGLPWVSIDLLAKSDFEASEIGLLVPVAGAPYPGEKELVLEQEVLEKIDAQVGDLLQIQLIDGTVREMQVVGVVQDQSTGAGDFLGDPLAYTTLSTLPWLRQSEVYDRMVVTVAQDENNLEHIRQVSNQVSDRIEKAGNQVFRTELSTTNEHPLSSTIQAVLGVLGALGVLVVFLSSSLIANTLNALLNQHQRFIGVMKLIGARSSHIIRMYMALILAFGVLALLISVPLGGQAAYALSGFIASQVNFNLQGYRIIPFAIVIQVIIGLVVPQVAGLLPVLNGSRVTIQRAISGYNPALSTARQGWFDQALKRVRFLSRPNLISLRNTFRRRGRLVLTLLTLTMGGAIFIGVFNVQASLERYITQIEKYFVADVTLGFDRLYRINEVRQQAGEIEGVRHVEGWAFMNAEVLREDGSLAENIQILAPPSGSDLVEPIILDGRWILPGDEKAITVSEDILTIYPDLKPGDTLRMKVYGGEDDWTVVGIFKFVGLDNILAYANFETISELINQPNQAFSYRIVTDRHDPDYQKMMAARIDEAFRERGFHVSEVEAGVEAMETASESLDILVTFLLIMALLTATVGSIGLAGTMGMNVLERTREIGVMRSIGAVDWQIVKSVILEGLNIGLISWLLGAILSFPIGWLLLRIISLAIFSTPVDYVFTWQGFAIWLGLVILMAILASVLPARNAARLTIREVLAYE